MESLVVSLAKGREVTEDMIAYELYEICDREHSSCNSECPVFSLNGNKIPDTVKDFEVNRGCDCFKDGKKMLEFIRNSR